MGSGALRRLGPGWSVGDLAEYKRSDGFDLIGSRGSEPSWTDWVGDPSYHMLTKKIQHPVTGEAMTYVEYTTERKVEPDMTLLNELLYHPRQSIS